MESSNQTAFAQIENRRSEVISNGSTNGSVSQYWARVREIENQLREVSTTNTIFISKIIDNGIKAPSFGGTCEAYLDVAARRIADKTHRLASTEEIDKWHADQKARERELAVANLKQQTKAVLVTQQEAAELGMPNATQKEKK